MLFMQGVPAFALDMRIAKLSSLSDYFCFLFVHVCVHDCSVMSCYLVCLLYSFLAVGSQDTSCRVYSLRHIRGFHYVNLAGHRSAVVSCFFEHNSLTVSVLCVCVCVCVDARLCHFGVVVSLLLQSTQLFK